MSQPILFLLMLLAGIGIPIMAALNASLGQQLNNPIAAVFVLCTVALLTSLLIILLFRQPIQWSQLTNASPILWGAGLLFIFYIGSITYASPKIGLGNAVLMVLLGQLVCAAVIDHYGLFGTLQFQLTMRRLAGFGAMLIGIFLVLVK